MGGRRVPEGWTGSGGGEQSGTPEFGLGRGEAWTSTRPDGSPPTRCSPHGGGLQASRRAEWLNDPGEGCVEPFGWGGPQASRLRNGPPDTRPGARFFSAGWGLSLEDPLRSVSVPGAGPLPEWRVLVWPFNYQAPLSPEMTLRRGASGPSIPSFPNTGDLTGVSGTDGGQGGAGEHPAPDQVGPHRSPIALLGKLRNATVTGRRETQRVPGSRCRPCAVAKPPDLLSSGVLGCEAGGWRGVKPPWGPKGCVCVSMLSPGLVHPGLGHRALGSCVRRRGVPRVDGRATVR